MSADRDDLLSPSLTQTERRDLPSGERPWRLGSQFYVAFFGGPLAAAAVGYLNGGRLGLAEDRRRMIAAAGVVGFAVAAVLASTLDYEAARPRFLTVASGALTYVVTHRLQKEADRRYGFGRDEDLVYDSLWQTGLAIAFGAGLLTAVALGALQ